MVSNEKMDLNSLILKGYEPERSPYLSASLRQAE